MGQITHGIKGPLQLHSHDNDSDTSSDSGDSVLDVDDAEEQERLQHLQQVIRSKEAKYLKHKAARTPRIANPFEGFPARQRYFEHMVQEKADALYVPPGYTFFPWNEVDSIKVGKRMTEVTVPETVWVPRAIEWVRAREILDLCLEEFDM